MCNHLFTSGTAVTVIKLEEPRLCLAELAETVAEHHGVRREQSCLQQETSVD